MDKRLIEVDFPLEEASLDSVHEKNVRHGHISTLHIWPARHPGRGERASHQYFIGMNGQPTVFVLMHEAVLLEDGPGFLECHLLHAVEDVVGHFWSAVGKSLAVPFGCVLDDILRSEETLLCARV